MSTDQLRPEQILDHVADGVYYVDKSRTITSWNKAAERITGFAADEVRGRSCADCILTHVDDRGVCMCTRECPLAATLQDGQRRESTLNLHHKSGYRIPVHIEVSPVHDDKGVIVGAVETFRECGDVIALRSSIERLKQWGCVDVASGLANRRIAEWQLGQRVQELQRFGWPSSVMLVEIDYFKELRARWGEEGLQDVVRMTAQCVQNSLRAVDLVARWDEVTFIAIVANTTIAELISIAERIRMMVDCAYRQTPDGDMHATVSIGAVAADARDSVESLLRKAERGLYGSRSAGRNRATIHGLTLAEDGI